MIEKTGAEIIVGMLERQGVQAVAGIPGGSVLPLYDALYASGIRHVLVRHEQGGGFIAQGMSRSTGVPGVCIATSGPGAMNLLTAIADARADSIPLVAITGQVNSYLIGTDAFQEVDTFGLSFPIAKHSVMVQSPRDLLRAIPEAFRIATSGRPGPVLIDVPRDVQTQRVAFDAWPEPGRRDREAERYRTEGEDRARALSEAASFLASSERPVIYAGGGCNDPGPAARIRELAESRAIPVVTSLMGIGVVPTAHPLYLGMVGMHGSRAANRAMHDADLVIAAGVRFDDRATGLIKRFCPDAKIIHLDIDAAEVNKILRAAVSIVGDAESSIAELSAAAGPESVAVRAARAEWTTRLAEIRDGDRAREAAAKDSPCSFIASIPRLASDVGADGDELIVATDVGQHQMWTAQCYPFSRPRQFLTSGSLGTMGFGLPAAIGAALANPGKRVVCFSGDGSIMMNVQELATLAELGLDVTVIVLDNGALGMVRQQQEMLFAGRLSASVFQSPPDLVRVAEGFGITAVDAGSAGWEKIAFGGSGPRFVRRAIGQGENVYPFVPAGKANVDAIIRN